MVCGAENSISEYYLAFSSFHRAFVLHFVAPISPNTHPYISACGIGYASKKLSKMAGNSASYPFNSLPIDRL